MIPVIMIATMCTKHVATAASSGASDGRARWGFNAEPTWLEEDGVRDFYISRVAIWLDSLRLAHKRAHNECGGLTNVVK